MENVPGIKSSFGGRILNEFITELPEKIIAPQIELGPKIKILNEEEKNTLELYNIPEDSEIPLYELIDSEKGKKIEVGSTNYLLLKYEDLSNNLMFYLLFSHLDPYKRYLTKGDEDNWISLKSFKDWLQVPFYIHCS